MKELHNVNQETKYMRAFHLETLHSGEIHILRYIILKPTVQITVLFWPFFVCIPK